MDEYVDSICDYSKSNWFSLELQNNEMRKCILVFQKEGCKAGYKNDEGLRCSLKNVVNEKCSRYEFFNNKGFYRDIDLFISTVETCWD